jgi:hypothetical protein
MKLRIKGNSIRLRLLRSEVDRFANDGKITDEIAFGANALRYSLQKSDAAEKVHARFDDNEIAIMVPSDLAVSWTTSETVGFEVEQPVGNNEALSILVEKDFVCIDRPDDPDRGDAYPNPNAEC